MSYSTSDLRALGAVSVNPTAIVYAFVSLAGDPSAADKALLTDAELQRSARLVRSIDSNHHVLAHAALRLFLARCLDVEPTTVRFEHGAHGKPHVADSAAHLEFNLSHSDDLGLICVARDRFVGVDVERIRHIPDALDIAEAHFSVAETRRLRSLPTAELDAAFLRSWTQKEAALKASGEGLSRALDSLDVDPSPGAVTEVRRWASDGFGNDVDLVVRDLPAPAGYAAAGAVITTADTPMLWQEL